MNDIEQKIDTFYNVLISNVNSKLIHYYLNYVINNVTLYYYQSLIEIFVLKWYNQLDSFIAKSEYILPFSDRFHAKSDGIYWMILPR